MTQRRIALGFRPHTGWAAMVAITGQAGQQAVDDEGPDLDLVDRRRVPLLDDEELPRQVFHSLRGLEAVNAEDLLDRVRASATAAAAALLDEASGDKASGDARAAGSGLVGIGVVAWQPEVPDDLDRILGSHQLMHAAEGDLYRAALLDAAQSRRVPAYSFLPADLAATAASLVGLSSQVLAARLTVLGRQAGPPWQKDQKEATLAAWAVLHITDPADRPHDRHGATSAASRTRRPDARGRRHR